MTLYNFAALFNLNHQQPYLHWSFVTISLANLIIMSVMAIIFGLAIMLPFPKSKDTKDGDEDYYKPEKKEGDDSSDNGMWTAKVRKVLFRIPAKQLLPDRQPAYVASWIYVFGVATLASLFVVIASGMALLIGGVNWWHVSPLGHFVNSLHLWSVELFMAFMVIHLWGKFWMAAWRGKRALTWMTGVLAFGISILEAFTGYLSQQNFDSQWIATNGKDAINATGMGSILNLMNFGQILAWHIVLIPLLLVLFVAIHIILVRVRGVTHPIQKAHGKAAKKTVKIAEASKWRGPTRRYDIIKEGTIATVIVLLLVFLLAGALSSPDEPAVTVQNWSKAAPADFMATVNSELNGTSESAQYGPPYNNGTHNVQKIGISWQLLAGVHDKINPAKTFVLTPLSKFTKNNSKLASALNEYNQASVSQQHIWTKAYASAISHVKFHSGTPIVPSANDGPVPTIVDNEYSLAKSGAIDASLLAQEPFYGTNYTKPLLFIVDGNYFTTVAKKNHLYGTQWGVMNETGSYPGQPWLWLYALWYQIPGFSTSANVDLIAIYLTGLSTLLLLMVPFIPGIRDIPKIVPLYKLIWRKWYSSKR